MGIQSLRPKTLNPTVQNEQQRSDVECNDNNFDTKVKNDDELLYGVARLTLLNP